MTQLASPAVMGLASQVIRALFGPSRARAPAAQPGSGNAAVRDARAAAVAALAAENERLEFLLSASAEGLWDWDLRSHCIHFSARFRDLLGYSAGEPFYAFQVVHHPEDVARVKQALRRHLWERTPIDEEFRLRCKNGKYKWFRGRGKAIWESDGLPVRFAGSLTDISDYKDNEQRLAYLAQHDVLTTLPNRRAFLERLAQGVGRAQQAGRPLAVLFVDLDRFKQINDVLGHDAGNRVLVEAAERIRSSLRDEDAVARLGGDEFTALVEGIGSAARVGAVADKIRCELNRPFRIGVRDIFITASIGVSLYPRDGDSGEELLKRADVAMVQAKKLGRDNHQFYSPEIEDRISRGLHMEARLRQALEEGELAVHYQPQVSLATGDIVSVEALLRWNNPELGWISPAQFIPLAEETGLIHPIGAWVLKTACEQARAWRDAGRPIKMCVNLSARQLDEKLVETVSGVLADTGLPASGLELEITEGIMIKKDPVAEAAIRSLSVLGVEFAIDDFGTGYASFDYLKRFRVHTLKVDGSFVSGLCSDSDDAAIVEATIALAHGLKLKVVAEGVETAEQQSVLRKLGCDACQGHYFFKALSAAELGAVLGSKYQTFPTDRRRLATAE